jgi:hypothetical protein
MTPVANCHQCRCCQYQRYRTPAANFSNIIASVVDTGGKFATGVNDTGGKFATGVRHLRLIYHRCKTPVANDGNNYQTAENLNGTYVTSSSQRCPKEIKKNFMIKDFSVCHRCHRHRWQTLSCDYLREFSKKIEMALTV